MSTNASTFYWLIELSPQCYLEVRPGTNSQPARFKWTSSHDAALKFVSKEQCQNTLDAVRNLDRELFPTNLPTCARALEHGWIAAPQQEKHT